MQQSDVSLRPIKVGSVIRVLKNSALKADENWQIVQLPQVESAFIGLDPDTGAVRALVGGFDFNRNKFNHVTQAWRQPGSSFKPFIYSAALEKGLTPASIFDDAPLSFSAGEVGSRSWTPNNYDGTFDGPMSMRQALIKSKNMVSIRILQAIDAYYAQDYVTRFGFDAKRHPPYLTMALGAGSVTPWQMAGAYAVFANGGYRVKPNLISKIVDANGKVIFEAKFDQASVNAPRVIDARNAFMMTSMLRDVVRRGTAAKAMALGRYDLAGKTGTTNNSIDAWFAGYNGKQVGVAWIGFDKPRSLGARETGGGVALPIWIKYMATVLKGTPNTELLVPDGIDALMVDETTGMQTNNVQNAIPEYFYTEYPPPDVNAPSAPSSNEEGAIDQLMKLLSPAQNPPAKPTDNNGKVDTSPKKPAPNNAADVRQTNGADSFVDQASQRGR
jgi:penicillin-binding protein 1A